MSDGTVPRLSEEDKVTGSEADGYAAVSSVALIIRVLSQMMHLLGET